MIKAAIDISISWFCLWRHGPAEWKFLVATAGTAMRIFFVGSVPDNDYDRTPEVERRRVDENNLTLWQRNRACGLMPPVPCGGSVLSPRGRRPDAHAGSPTPSGPR